LHLAGPAFNSVTKANRSLNAVAYEQAEAAWLLQEHSIVAYINREKDLFQQKFIFLVNNHSMRHWLVTVAIHPGLVDNADVTSLCGLLHMDSSSPGKRDCTVQPDPRFGFRFFLNYAYSILVQPAANNDVSPKRADALPDVVPFREPFGPSMHAGATSAFPHVVFTQPAIILQREAVNCALAVVINVALFLEKMLNLQLTRNGHGVVDRGEMLVLDVFYSPVSELKHLRPEYLCEMFRREMEVFHDRLALLTHQPRYTLNVDVESFRPFFACEVTYIKAYMVHPCLYQLHSIQTPAAIKVTNVCIPAHQQPKDDAVGLRKLTEAKLADPDKFWWKNKHDLGNSNFNTEEATQVC
jgi:hypothetical protein